MADNPQPTPTPEPDPAPPATGDAGGDQPAERTFTQAELDAIVKDRVRRVKAEPPPDYEDLKAKAAKLDELEEANASELEKATKRAELAEQKIAEIQAEAKEARLRAAILAEAAKADRKVVDPEAVIALLDRETLELDDDGLPKNIAKAMDSLLEKRPYLVASGGPTRGSADQGARTGAPNQLSDADLKTMSPEAIDQAHKEGRLDTLLGVSR